MKIYEIYKSIQGESRYQGYPCTFVRLSGCNLRCTWCDTAYAFFGGQEMNVDMVIEKIKSEDTVLVEITGGEPLLQQDSLELMTRLCDDNYIVLLETGGSIDLSQIDKRVIKIVDFKAPSSLMVEENLWDNVEHLTETDEIKIVIGDKADFAWAVDRIEEFSLIEKAAVNLSPVHGSLDPQIISEWILKNNLDVRLNLQLHKYIWDESASGV